jgi:hypothetical protein
MPSGFHKYLHIKHLISNNDILPITSEPLSWTFLIQRTLNKLKRVQSSRNTVCRFNKSIGPWNVREYYWNTIFFISDEFRFHILFSSRITKNVNIFNWISNDLFIYKSGVTNAYPKRIIIPRNVCNFFTTCIHTYIRKAWGLCPDNTKTQQSVYDHLVSIGFAVCARTFRITNDGQFFWLLTTG